MVQKEKLNIEDIKKQVEQTSNLYWGGIAGNHDDNISLKPSYITPTQWNTLASDIDISPLKAPSESERLYNKINMLERKVDALVDILSKVVRHEEDLAAVRKVIED